MKHIDAKTCTYFFGTSYKYAGKIDYMTCHNLFYYNHPRDIFTIKMDMLILSTWLREEFIEFIKVSKSFEDRRRYYKYFNNYTYCLDDLENNIDKYLDEITIRSVIE